MVKFDLSNSKLKVTGLACLLILLSKKLNVMENMKKVLMVSGYALLAYSVCSSAPSKSMSKKCMLAYGGAGLIALSMVVKQLGVLPMGLTMVPDLMFIAGFIMIALSVSQGKGQTSTRLTYVAIATVLYPLVDNMLGLNNILSLDNNTLMNISLLSLLLANSLTNQHILS